MVISIDEDKADGFIYDVYADVSEAAHYVLMWEFFTKKAFSRRILGMEWRINREKMNTALKSFNH